MSYHPPSYPADEQEREVWVREDLANLLQLLLDPPTDLGKHEKLAEEAKWGAERLEVLASRIQWETMVAASYDEEDLEEDCEQLALFQEVAA